VIESSGDNSMLFEQIEQIKELMYVIDLPFKQIDMKLPTLKCKEEILQLNDEYLKLLGDYEKLVDQFNINLLQHL
jgi:archaellum component FlaC